MDYEYNDTTLLETLKSTDVPRILTDRVDGTVVYVALSDDGESLVEVDIEELDD